MVDKQGLFQHALLPNACRSTLPKGDALKVFGYIQRRCTATEIGLCLFRKPHSLFCKDRDGRTSINFQACTRYTVSSIHIASHDLTRAAGAYNTFSGA